MDFFSTTHSIPRLWKGSLIKKLDIERVKQPVLECIIKTPKVVEYVYQNMRKAVI